MKKLFIFSFLIVLWAFQLQAQTPHAMKYQTVIRNNAGEALVNKLVAIRASILSGSTSGTMVYQEVHNIATNEFGIANLNIGEGTVQSGIFNNIAWGNANHFLKIEIDIANGTNFAFMGTSQLLSVPYALYAEKSANAIDDFDKDSTNELQNIQKIGNTVTLNKNGGSFTDSDNQTLTIVGNQLQISNGNSVTFAGAVDMDADPTNELQTISKSGDTIKLSKNGGNILLPNEHTLSSTANGTNRTINITGGTGTTINIADNDNDTTNELQTITKTGNTITLSKNGGSFTESDNQNLSLSTSGTQRTVNISNGNGITLDIADKDNDSTNELQTLSYSNDTLKLTKANSIELPNNFDFKFPDGMNNISPITIDSYTYIVPSNKNLYITSFDGSNININSKNIFNSTGGNAIYGGSSNFMVYFNIINPIILGSNDTLTGTGVFNGFLINKKITVTTKDNLLTTPYTVPNGKIFTILNIRTNSVSSGLVPEVYINNKRILYGAFNNKTIYNGNYSFQAQIGGVLYMPIFLKQGDVVSSNFDDTVINGYLK